MRNPYFLDVYFIDAWPHSFWGVTPWREYVSRIFQDAISVRDRSRQHHAWSMLEGALYHFREARDLVNSVSAESWRDVLTYDNNCYVSTPLGGGGQIGAPVFMWPVKDKSSTYIVLHSGMHEKEISLFDKLVEEGRQVRLARRDFCCKQA